jgi:pyrroline-5-carboxylate reductase
MTSVGLIGTGNMGAAVIRGLLARGGVEVHGADVDKKRVDELAAEGMNARTDARDLAAACDYVVLAVKPHQIGEVVSSIRPELDPGKCLVSIAAGVKTAAIAASAEGACPVVRVMPNTPAMVGEGVFAVCLDDDKLSQEQRDFVPELFESLGQVHILPEKSFDAFTAIAGSGPAYVFYFMEALIEAGVTMGLTRDQTTQMVKGLFTGSAKLASDPGRHVSMLKEMVTSPGGTTIQALNHFDRMSLKGAIIDAVELCCERSRELGEED